MCVCTDGKRHSKCLSNDLFSVRRKSLFKNISIYTSILVYDYYILYIGTYSKLGVHTPGELSTLNRNSVWPITSYYYFFPSENSVI